MARLDGYGGIPPLLAVFHGREGIEVVLLERNDVDPNRLYEGPPAPPLLLVP